MKFEGLSRPRQQFKIQLSKFKIKVYFWWLWSECSPLPIPNREVKPHIADDTALVCGKVGRRQSFIRSSKRDSFFCFPISSAFFPRPRFRLRCIHPYCQRHFYQRHFFIFFNAISFFTPFLLSSLESLVFS